MSKSPALFRKTRILEGQIDEFLDCITEAGLIFQRAIKIYLEQGASDEFAASTKQSNEIETHGDNLRRIIETQLYEQTLIPDLRADVLKLLEDLDNLINIIQANCYRFTIEVPDIPPEYHKDFMDLTETVVTCVDTVVMSARAFFRNIEAVRDHNSKVMFYETEADKISTKLKTKAFRSDLPKVEKIHLRYFVERIDELANEAEDIADSLAIFTIKRSI
ncbi:MAG: DUF47 family protein [Rhodospirillales bacterium]|nr:DUF47 family protein [Rhodospirillales bacterium]